MAKRVLVVVGGVEYPMYRTMRAAIEIEKTDYVQKSVAGSVEAMTHVAYIMIKCASKRENVEFEHEYEEFLDLVDPDLIEKMAQINQDDESEKLPSDVVEPGE